MKFTKIFAMVAFAALAFVGCDGNEKQPEQPNTQGNLELRADKIAVAMGGTVNFSVWQKDEAGELVDVTAFSIIYDNDLQPVEGGKYTFNATGSYSFFATKGEENSNYVTITVMAEVPELPADEQPDNLAFNHRVLLIDHTGVGCGYCPGMIDRLMTLGESEWHKHYNEVTCHAGSYAGGDPANSAAANALNRVQSSMISGYPTLCLNFWKKVENSAVAGMKAALEGAVKKDGADAGIAMAVEGDPSAVYCAAQVKSAVSQEYKVVAWLLENGIYSPNQSGATQDHHRIYNFALRNISGEYTNTNVSGESVGVINAGETLDCSFSLPIISTKWNYENMGVLVIVSAKDANNRWEVVNTAYCELGEYKAYEYVE